MHIQNRISAEQVAGKGPVTKTATCTLKVYENVVDIDSSAGTAITITLPTAAEAIGLLFSLYVTAYSGAITIADGSQSLDFTAPTFDGVDDGQLLYSDGKRWWQFGTRT